MNKDLLRFIGIQVLVLGLVLSVFEFLIENSEGVIGAGIVILLVSLLVKR